MKYDEIEHKQVDESHRGEVRMNQAAIAEPWPLARQWMVPHGSEKTRQRGVEC
jgi:hypothetical protein